MRYRILPFLFALVLMLATTTASSAANFSLYGSYWDTDELGASPGVGARAAFFDGLQLEVGAGYYTDLEEELDISLPGDDAFAVPSLEAIPVEVGLRYNFPRFYIGGGGAYYLLEADNGDPDDELGAYVRAGFQFEHFFLEANYHDVEATLDNFEIDADDGEIDVIDDVAFDLTGFIFNLGWRF